MKIDSVHAEFMSGNAVSYTTSSHSIVSRGASGDIHAAGVTIAGNSGTLFSYSDGTRSVYGGCNASDPWFGTSSDHDLRLVTNGSEQMRIDNTGKVGIGTASPQEKLDVRGATVHPVVEYAYDQDAPYLIAAGTTYDDTTTNWATQGIQHRIKTSSGGVPRVTIDTPSGGEAFCVQNGGNVGIGVASPAYKLDIHDSTRAMMRLKCNATSGDGDAILYIDSSQTGESDIDFMHDGALNWRLRTGDAAGTNFQIHDDDDMARFVIKQDGNVGIGTTSPARSLDSRSGDGSSSAGWISGVFGPATGLSTNPRVVVGTYSNVAIVGSHRGDLGAWTDLYLNNPSYPVVVKANGNVGIGTTSPAHNLDIYSNHASDPTFLRLVGNSSDRAGIKLGESTGAGGGQCVLEYDGTGAGVNNRFQIYSDESSWPGKTGGFTYIPANGYVGIGTQSPGGRLHICSGTSGDCHLIIQSDTDNNNEQDNPKIVFRQDGAINTAEIGIENSGGNPNMLALRGTAGIVFYDGTNSSTDIDYIENTSTEHMRIESNGKVGINNSSPSYKLDVSGDSRVVGKCIVQTNNNANGIVCTGTSGGLAYYSYRDGDPGIKLTRTSVFTGEDNEYTISLLPAPGGTPRGNTEDLGSSSHYWRRTYTNEMYRSNEYGLSDDRIKTGETLVENATETLLKLKPQTYDKHTFEFDKFTEEEYNNVSSDNTVFSAHSNCWVDQTELIENTIDEREEFPWVRRRLTEESQRETGLIAQDIWYDAPELRHIVGLPADALPAEDKPTGGDDPQQDPDYDEAGWGMESASVSYTQLISVLVKSNQELHERLVDHDAQLTDLESQLQAEKVRNDALESQLQAEKVRNDALESRVTELEGMVSLIRQNMTWQDE